MIIFLNPGPQCVVYFSVAAGGDGAAGGGGGRLPHCSITSV